MNEERITQIITDIFWKKRLDMFAGGRFPTVSEIERFSRAVSVRPAQYLAEYNEAIEGLPAYIAEDVVKTLVEKRLR